MDLLDFFFPRLCVGCKKPGGYFCSSCINKIDYINRPICPICERPSMHGLTHPICQKPLGLDGMFVLAHYKFPLSSAIQKYKYKYVRDLTSVLSELLIKKLSLWPILNSPYTINHKPYTVIPIPLHSSRLKWRGFNQSELLAQKISEYFNIPINITSLIRTKETTPQATLKTEKERRENIENAFEVKSKEQIMGKIIFLIDDLSTTGETIKEAAKTLKRNGVGKVYGIVLARGRA